MEDERIRGFGFDFGPIQGYAVVAAGQPGRQLIAVVRTAGMAGSSDQAPLADHAGPVAGFLKEHRDRDIAAASRAWEKAKELIRDPNNRMVLLDELNIALRYDYLNADDVAEFLLAEKPEMTHVVITGRNAPERLIEIADLVSEMKEIKHPYREQGIKAQPGLEF